MVEVKAALRRLLRYAPPPDKNNFFVLYSRHAYLPGVHSVQSSLQHAHLGRGGYVTSNPQTPSHALSPL